MVRGGMWVAKSPWDGADLGICGQRSWCGQVVVTMLQCTLRPGEDGGRMA